MHISPLEEYGLRCALTLASHYNDRKSLSARKISEIEGISMEYVSKVMFLFRKSKLVTASRGIHGGFQLSLDPNKINLKNITDSLRQKKTLHAQGFCHHYSGNNQECKKIGNCSVRPVWTLLNQSIDSFFSQLTLSDLMGEEKHTHQKIHSILLNSFQQSMNKGLQSYESSLQ